MFTKNPACWNCYEKKTACSNKNRHVELKSGMLKIRQKNGMCLHRSFCWCVWVCVCVCMCVCRWVGRSKRVVTVHIGRLRWYAEPVLCCRRHFKLLTCVQPLIHTWYNSDMKLVSRSLNFRSLMTHALSSCHHVYDIWYTSGISISISISISVTIV
jgi:hypothetical protein